MACRPSACGSRPAAAACPRIASMARADVVVGTGDHPHPAVAELAGTAPGGRTRAADPDRQRGALRRLGLHRDGVDVERLAALLDAFVAPAGPQQPDRLVHLAAAAGVVVAERAVLGLLPTDTDAEAHPAARQRVQCADLLGDEHRLALGQHEDLGRQRDPLRHRGDVPQRHERLQDRHLRRIDRRLAGLRGVAHDDVVEHRHVVVADRLDGPSQLEDLGRALPVGDARELDGDEQAPLPRVG